MDEYGNEQVIIDGGIVCNNPSLVAYIMANVIRKKKHIRVISLGTGVGPL
jgi:patatin-like phospholipase/acyl hydrolase